MKTKNTQGFTLLEILLVIAAIAILAGIVILAINPSKQLKDARNVQRRADVNTILNAVYQYTLDSEGVLPGTINTTATEICATKPTSNVSDCANLVNLAHITNSEIYLPAFPSDPNGSCGANGICYEILKTANNRITVSAPDAEDVTISVTR